MDLRGLDSEYLYSREDILSEMDRHNEVFNLKDFYGDDSKDLAPSFTGFRIITKDREYSGYCYPYSMYHDDVLENVLFALYGNEYNRVYKETDYNMRDTSARLGAVFIQMLSKHYTLVWIPNSINEFQRDCLLNYFSDMEKINESRREAIQFGVAVAGDDGNYYDVDGNEVTKVIPGLVDKKKTI